MQHLQEFLTREWLKRAAITVLLVIGAYIAIGMATARAADKGAPQFLEVPEPSTKAPWTGIYGGVGGGKTVGVLSPGGPIGLSADGWMVSPKVGGCLQAGQLVGCVEGAYSFMFGDLKTLGINREISVTPLGGFLVTPSTLVYGHVTWARLNTDFGNIDGWKFGGGMDVKVPNAPVSLDFRYSYGDRDVSGLPSGWDVNDHTFMVTAKYWWK